MPEEKKKAEKKICWVSMGQDKPKYCVGDKCMAWGYRKCAIVEGLSALSYYINRYVIRGGGRDFE